MGPLQGLATCLSLALILGAALGATDRLPAGALSVLKPVVAETPPAGWGETLAEPVTINAPMFALKAPVMPPAFRPRLAIDRIAASQSASETLASFPALAMAVPSQRKDRQRGRPAARPAVKTLFAFLPRPARRPAAHTYSLDRPSATLARVPLDAAADIDDDLYALNDAAYSALARGDEAAALALFQSSLDVSPAQPDIQSQVGYIEKARGNYAQARAAFQAAARFGRIQPNIQRELSQLSRPLRLSGYTVWREGSRRVSDPAFGPSLAQSQSGIGATYRLPLNGWPALHGLSLTSRVLWAYEPESVSPDSRTTQAGLGLQVRPFKAANLALAAERLIAIGADSRSDWLLRASYSAGRGYQPPLGDALWLHWSGYLDAAIIDPADPDVQVLGDARLGLGYQPFDRSSFSVIPFAGLSGSYEHAAGRATDLYEAAAGVWLRLWPGGPDLKDPIRALDLRLEYREKLAGDSPSGSGLRLTFGVTY